MEFGTISAVAELQSVSGSKAKMSIINKHKGNKDFLKMLNYALDPMKTYKLSEKTINERRVWPTGDSKYVVFTDIFDVCDRLASVKAVDDNTLLNVQVFLSKCTDAEREIYTKVLSKTLRLGVTGATVNRVVPGLIPEWEVQQAYPVDKYPVRDGAWFALTQKLNGVRATYYNGRLISRTGIPYEGLNHITDILSTLHTDLVFDGELTLVDTRGISDNEAFRKATGIINSDAEHKTEIRYTIFDVIKKGEFDNGVSNETYKVRRERLNTVSDIIGDNKFVSVLPTLYTGTNLDMIDTLLDQMVAEDKEGLMINLDVPYKRKRHNGILKVKRFYTMDLRVVGVEEGTGRLSGTLGALVLDYIGNEVRVGTGFSDALRVSMWEHRDDIIGSICEVKYKEISQDKRTGVRSLQFPVFVSMRNDKNSVSYG